MRWQSELLRCCFGVSLFRLQFRIHDFLSHDLGILDNGDGRITHEEFVDGILRCKGRVMNN